MAKKVVMSDPNTRQETQRELVGNATDAETVKRNVATAVITPALAAAWVILNAEGKNGLWARLDLLALTDCLKEQAAKVRAGNLAQVETMLLSQATAQRFQRWLASSTAGTGTGVAGTAGSLDPYPVIPVTLNGRCLKRKKVKPMGT